MHACRSTLEDPTPILVEATRGGVVENRHRGAFAICDAEGAIIASAGDIERPVFPRSAIKSMQALTLFTSGAVEKFAVTDEELALACASHHGEPAHTARVEAFLARLGLSASDLECGAHQPSNSAARQGLREKHADPSQLHNNCSGKHAGMLADALALGADTHGYVGREHPVQVAVRENIEAVIGRPLSVDLCGTDGCSIPTWAAPLSAFAAGFAKMAAPNTLRAERAEGARRLFDAATGHPHLVAGTGHLDTLVMEAFAGRVMQKGGAEGVQCGAIRDKGWGYAVKIDDGRMEASHVAVASLLLAFASPDSAQREVLNRFARQTIRNVRGLEVGELRATPVISAAA